MPAPRVFVSYSHANSNELRELQACLEPLQREGAIDPWYDYIDIQPGSDWRDSIQRALQQSKIALFLVTGAFLESPYCREVEIPRLLNRAKEGGVTLLPVIYDTAEWQKVPWLERLQVLPEQSRRILDYERREDAWKRVADQVRRVARRVGPRVQTSKLSLDKLLADLPGTGSEPFFGREEHLAFLDKAFNDPNCGVAALWAFGGVGKSALVRHWLSTRAPREEVRFLGCSFFDQGTREHAGTSDQFIVRALRDLGDATPNGGELWRRGRRLAELASTEPTLVVLDGLEPLQFGAGDGDRAGHMKDAGVRELLTALTEKPGRSLCIVTSRLRVADPTLQRNRVRERELDMLSVDEARQLLRHRNISGTDEQLDEAAEHLGLHALALVLAAEYLDTFKEGRIEAIHDIRLLDHNVTGVRAGRHAKSVMAAYEEALEAEGSHLALELLNILGLFDRPMQWEWLDALQAPPVIPGVTERLAIATDAQIQESLRRLRKWRLAVDAGPTEDAGLDAHPLTREYFGDRLRRKWPDGWRDAHSRLYEYLAATTGDDGDVESMTLLMQAVVHACKAGRHRDALHDVYVKRVMRGDELYAMHALGAIGLLLSTLSHYFEDGDWTRPLESLEQSDRMLLLTHAGVCLTATRGYSVTEVGQVYEAAWNLSFEVANSRETFIALFGLWRYALMRSDVERTHELVETLSAMPRRLKDPSITAAAERVRATTFFFDGAFAAAAEAGERGTKLRGSEEILRRDSVVFLYEPTISCQGYLALALWHLGDAERAVKESAEAVALAQQLGHGHTLAIGLLLDAMLAHFRHDVDAVYAKAQELVRVCTDGGFSLWRLAGEALEGWAMTRRGNGADGIPQMEESLAGWKEKGASLFAGYWMAMIAESQLYVGALDDARFTLEDALAWVDRETWWEPEIHRLQGELELARGDREAAEREFREAIELARARGSVALEQRAAASLAAVAPPQAP